MNFEPNLTNLGNPLSRNIGQTDIHSFEELQRHLEEQIRTLADRLLTPEQTNATIFVNSPRGESISNLIIGHDVILSRSRRDRMPLPPFLQDHWEPWFESIRQSAPQIPGIIDYSLLASLSISTEVHSQENHSTRHYNPPDFFSNDPYKILGLSPDASPQEATKRYRKLALEFHPDRATGDAQLFKKIHQAYEQLQPQLQSVECFIFDRQGDAETNYILANKYADYLEEISPDFSLSKIEPFISLVEQFINQLRLADGQSGEPLLILNRERLIQNTQALLYLNKVKYAVLSLRPPLQSLSVDAKISHISEQITLLDTLKTSCDLSNFKKTWTGKRSNSFHIANSLVMDKYLSLQRNIIELLHEKDDKTAMKTVVSSTKTAYKNRITEGLQRGMLDDCSFFRETEKYMPPEPPTNFPPTPEVPAPEIDLEPADQVDFPQKSTSIPLKQRLIESIEKQFAFFPNERPPRIRDRFIRI